MFNSHERDDLTSSIISFNFARASLKAVVGANQTTSSQVSIEDGRKSAPSEKEVLLNLFQSQDCAYVGTNIADEYLSPVSVQDQEKDGVPNTLQTCQPPFESRSNSVTELADLDFDHIELISAVDEHRIRARWLESLLPSIDQRPKTFAASTMKFVWQVFKSYPAMFVGEDSSPPFIHWAQMKVVRCELLVNCVNVSHMWANKAAGTGNMVIEIIERQMTRLFDQRAKYNQLEMLAALQAYLLYSMMLFFEHSSPKSLVDQDVMIKLQSLAGDVAGTGTVCLAETRDTRPDWESWITASAKRRTLFVTSMFDNLVNFTLGTPSFIATELAELPAPASKRLWESSNRKAWNMAYNQHLSEWTEGPFLISELWPQADMNSARRQQRLGQWLSGVDEFGMMIYSVTAHTYGG